MNMITELWKPFWYELDYSIAVGEVGYFKCIKNFDMVQFATAVDDEQGEKMKIKILKISNAELGNIVKIDTETIPLKSINVTEPE